MEIVLYLNGKPVAKLMLVPQRRTKRIGFAKGMFEVPGDLDAGDDDIEGQFPR
jgi:hypothetical protein